MQTQSLRSQYAATSTKQLKAVVEEENAKVAVGKYSDNLPIEDGINKFRLMPKHPSEEAFTHIQCRHWLSRDDDGEEKRMTVPNSKIHGNTEKDIIEEYIAFIRRTLSATDAEDAAKIKLLTAYPGGINMQTSWIAYAYKIEKDKKSFGILELKRSVRDALNNAAIIEDESEAIEVDPFTDPDSGLPILITYNSKAKKSTDYYKLQVSKTPIPLTDDELEAFSKVDPLSTLKEVNYTINDFEHALEGLQFFDDNNDINLFESDEFQAIIEEVKAQYDESERKVDGEDKTTKAPAIGKKKTVIKAPIKTAIKSSKMEEVPEEFVEEPVEEMVDDTPETDAYDEMDRNGLKSYIVKSGYRDAIKVYQNDTDDDIRTKIRNLEVESPFVGEEAAEEVAEPVAAKKIVNKAFNKLAGNKPTLEDIKNKLAGNTAKK